MDRVEKLQALQQIKTLADPRRLEILRLLMAEPATLTQLGEVLDQSPAWVRHHLQKLQDADLIELAETRTTGKVTEKYYQAQAGAYLLQQMVLPRSQRPVIIFSGSHDLALDNVAHGLERHAHLLTLPVGSLDGLVNLRQGLCQVSGAHLLGDDGTYNTPFVHHLFPDRDMNLVTFAHRTQGLILAPGNPLGARSLWDLARADVRFINRNPGSGTRVWLDGELKRMGIPTTQIQGFEQVAFTHNATARAVAEGRVDIALGLQAAAEKFGLAFIPLFNERYDLVFPKDSTEHLEILLNHIQSFTFRQQLNQLGGYQSNRSGEQVAV